MAYTVDKFLDSGTQAAVYLVSAGGKKYALKWYSKTNDTLVNHFRKLIQNGVPKDQSRQPDKRFVWPQDLIVTEKGFGYTMDLIEMDKYTKLHRLTHFLYIKEENYIKGSALCDICINIAEAFISLHSSGYCYKDISSNNIVFNIKTGDILIFDVDNVVVDGETGEIKGTPKYMAPEVILGKIHPDSQSDRFSLASYFFHLLVGHYPLEGKLRDDYIKVNKVFDDDGFKNVYGTNATFCFNPTNTRNNLNSPDYKKVVERWEGKIPLKLKEKFNKTFIKGLPFEIRAERTTNKEWVSLFREFKQGIVTCSCGRDYFPGAIRCTACQKSLTSSSAKISVQEKGSSKQKEVVLKSGATIKGKQISKIISAESRLAEVLANPKTGELGLKNLSSLKWYYKDPKDPKLMEVPSGNIVTLKRGRTIAFVRGEVQVVVQ
jgi:serine/threonine protein kinase